MAVKNMVSLPTIPARGVVVFPKAMTAFDVARKKSVQALEFSLNAGRKVFIPTQKDFSVEHPDCKDVYEIGTVAEVQQCVKRGEGEYRVMLLGLYRAKLNKFISKSPFYIGEVQRLREKSTVHMDLQEKEAWGRLVKTKFYDYLEAVGNFPRELSFAIEAETNLMQAFYQINTHVPMRVEVKQAMLQEDEPVKRFEMLTVALDEESRIAKLQQKIAHEVEQKMDRQHRDYFLREQMRFIQQELGEDESENFGADFAKYKEAIAGIQNIGEDAREKLFREAQKLTAVPENSQEAFVTSSYLDVVLRLPWDVKTQDNDDLKVVQAQLDRDHYGLKDVKERILELLAVRSFQKDLKGQIICLVGPPGVGKTSIGRSIATALGRKFVRISLGGVGDESEIRGHRKTYIGAMPGRIISGMMQAKSRNPVVLLDEIDKLGRSFKGDTSAAMLEVLDPEQNSTFTDHYVDVPFDLSDCLFITTSNTISSIPAPLLDRMEVIELSSYTREEKFHIAKEYLVQKQVEKHGLKKKQFAISDAALYVLIEGYTKEAGVRNLERAIASLCRKTAKELLQEKKDAVRFSVHNLEVYLGPRKHLDEQVRGGSCVGVVNGLAYTSVGGELMQIEAVVMDGKGKVQLTGNLGDVMKESAKTAISYVRSVAEKYCIPADSFQTKDIHIHVPEGAVPKDGPSAGIALATVVISALSNIPVRQDVAMTGEITLRGRDLPIGGLKEKSIAAYKSGVKVVLIPKENQRDLVEVSDAVKDVLTFIPCNTIQDALQVSLIQPDKAKRSKAGQKEFRAGHAAAEV